MSDKGYKLFEVRISIQGDMAIHLRAQDEQEALISAGNIAMEMERESRKTIVPNLCNWRVDRTVQPIIIEKGEIDD